METQRAKLEDEKLRVFEEFNKIQRKMEDEVELRLYFEQKLNSLHSINMKYESKL